MSASSLSQIYLESLNILYSYLGAFEPAFSSSLKTMYAVNTPPMRKKESTDGKALSTASNASPWEPLKRQFVVEVQEWSLL